MGKTAKLDSHCQFCKKFSKTMASSEGLEQEIEALAKIKASVTADNYVDENNNITIWRYATSTGGSRRLLAEGWIAEI
jgi:hypothetical protein